MLTKNAKVILDGRYRQRNYKEGFTETHDDIWQRIAKDIAAQERTEGLREHWSKKFYEEMSSLRWLPNSPTIMNAGTGNGLAYNACYVCPLDDTIISERAKIANVDNKSLEFEDELSDYNNSGITDCIQQVAIIQKTGGGTGMTLDRLRPTGDWIASSKSKSGGPMGFWHTIAAMSGAMQQGGKRRGANMMTMSLWHPDILKFITAKDKFDDVMSETLGYKARRFGNFNISVKIRDAEMKTILENCDTPFVVRNPRDSKTYYIPKNIDISTYQIQDLVSTECRAENLDGKVKVKVDQDSWIQIYTYGDIWDMIVERAHAHADPGIIFWDRVDERNVLPPEYPIETTNPCGEQALEYNGVCNLGSIDLAKFVDEGEILWDSLKESWQTLYRFLDNVIDATPYPTIDIQASAKRWRRIGPGVMGWANMLFALGIPYDSEEATTLAEGLGTNLNAWAIETNKELANEKGAFPGFELSSYDKDDQRRNAFFTTIAPTGTISILANTTGGIEPAFAPAFERHVMRDHTGKAADTELDVNYLFDKALDDFFGLPSWPETKAWILEQASKNQSIQHISYEDDIEPRMTKEFSGAGYFDYKKLWNTLKSIFVCAHDISWEWHTEHQAAWTNHFCGGPGANSVSKTVNMKHDATQDDVRKFYKMAWERGCIGTTMYRDGSHDGQPMAASKDEEKPLIEPMSVNELLEGLREAQKNQEDPPSSMKSHKVHIDTSVGKLHLSMPHVEGMPKEVWAEISKGGTDLNSLFEAFSRCISLGLQKGVPIQRYINTLEGIGTTRVFFGNGGKQVSIPDSLALAMASAFKEITENETELRELRALRDQLDGEVEEAANIYLMQDSAETPVTVGRKTGNLCPTCGTMLVIGEGCRGGKCNSCGHSEC